MYLQCGYIMDVQRGHCWRCEKALPDPSVHCNDCPLAVYCSTTCQDRDKVRHGAVECQVFGPKCNNCGNKATREVIIIIFIINTTVEQNSNQANLLLFTAFAESIKPFWTYCHLSIQGHQKQSYQLNMYHWCVLKFQFNIILAHADKISKHQELSFIT